MNYWNECISEAFDDAKIIATKEQIETVVSWVEGAHENYGMAHGHDCIPNPLQGENEDLKRKLSREQNKEICAKCKGKGHLTTQGPCHSSNSSCYVCRGEGYIYRD